jgi:hypothetical protein
MAKRNLISEMKTRVEPEIRSAFEREAELRRLDLSDLIREALGEYLKRRSRPRKLLKTAQEEAA